MSVNDRCYAAFSQKPDFVTIAEFDGGDVVRLIEKGPRRTVRKRRSESALLSAAFEFAFSLAPGASVAFVISSPMRDRIAPRVDRDFGVVRETVIRKWREKIGPRKITVGDREVSDTVEAQTAFILVNATRFAFKPGPRNYDRTWIRDGSAQALALLWAGLIEEAKAYVLWYAKRIYENGLVPPILNVDGTVNTGYGSNIEFDAQGEFVGIAADVYRISKDRVFLNAVFEPVVRATRFIEELCARTNARYGPETRFHGLLAPSISHEGYSKPSYSYWDDYFALSAWRNCEYLALEFGDQQGRGSRQSEGPGVRREPYPLHPHDRRAHEDGPHSWLCRPRRRRSDFDLDRLRALPSRRRVSPRIGRRHVRPRRRPRQGGLFAWFRSQLLAL